MTSRARPVAEGRQGLSSHRRRRGPGALGDRAGRGAAQLGCVPSRVIGPGGPRPRCGHLNLRHAPAGALWAHRARVHSRAHLRPLARPSTCGAGAEQLCRERVCALSTPSGTGHRPRPRRRAERKPAYRPHLPLHKAAPLSPRGIAATAGPGRLLPRAGAPLPQLPAWVLLVLGSGEALTHPRAGLWDLRSPWWFPTPFPITETPHEMPLALFYRRGY